MERDLERVLSSQGIRKVVGNTYTIDLPKDYEGRMGRECYMPECSPAYFKVKPGTGITSGHQTAFCPYCRAPEAPARFFTQEQKRYFSDKLAHATEFAIGGMLEKAFRPTKRSSRSSSFSITFKADPPKMKHARRPFEEELQRVVVCPHCGLDHAVFGLATWYPDCGRDIFQAHVGAELAVVHTMLTDTERRREVLGARVSARDIENCLEDVVSIFEAVGKILLGRLLRTDGKTKEEVEDLLKRKVRNRLQSIDGAEEVMREYAGVELLDGMDPQSVDMLRATFEKRHPITHNLGVVDRKYLEKAMSAVKEGRDVRVSVEEVGEAIGVTERILSGLHEVLSMRTGGTA